MAAASAGGGSDQGLAAALAGRAGRAVALVDGRNVQRSAWPNLADEELVRRIGAWARGGDMYAVVAFDGATPAEGDGAACAVAAVRGESADDWLARAALALAQASVPFWLVTSDRELRARAGGAAARTLGGGTFLRRLPLA